MFGLPWRSGVLSFQALQCPSHDLVGSLAPLFYTKAGGEREERIEHFDQRHRRLVAALQFVELFGQLVIRHWGFPSPPPFRSSVPRSRRGCAFVTAPRIIVRPPCPPHRAAAVREAGSR